MALAVATLLLAFVNVFQANQREQDIDKQVQQMHSGLFDEFKAAKKARAAAEADQKRAAEEYSLAHQAQVEAAKFRDQAQQRLLSLDGQLQQATTDLAAMTEEMNNVKAEAKKFRDAREKAIADLEGFIDDIENGRKTIEGLGKKLTKGIGDLFD